MTTTSEQPIEISESKRGSINSNLTEVGARKQTSGTSSRSRKAQRDQTKPEREKLAKLEAEHEHAWRDLVVAESEPIRDKGKCQELGAAYLKAQHAMAEQTYVLKDAIEAKAPDMIAEAEAEAAASDTRAMELAEKLRDELNAGSSARSFLACMKDANTARQDAPVTERDTLRHRHGGERIDKMIADIKGPEKQILVDQENLDKLKRGVSAVDLQGVEVERLGTHVRLVHNRPQARPI